MLSAARPAVIFGLLALVGIAAGAALFGRQMLASDMSSQSFCSDAVVRYCLVAQQRSGQIALPEKTAYWRSVAELDEQDLPVVVSPEGQRSRNPSSIAFTWLSRTNTDFDETCRTYAPGRVQHAAREYLENTAVQLDGGKAITWHYEFETHINDVLLKPPFASAFAQAAIIERLLIHHCKTGEARFAELARQAGRAFAIPVTAGGLRSEADDLVWFQEVPLPDRHNPFIVNAHLYAIENLLRLDRLFPDEGFRALAEKGVQSVRRALHVIDTGYWNRYDLRPRYSPVHFWIEGNGVLRDAVLETDRQSHIRFRRGKQDPIGNGFAQATTEPLAELGIRLSNKPLEIWFATSHGREFSPALIEMPLQLRISFDGVAEAVRVSALSARPGNIEIARLPQAKAAERSSDAGTIIVPVSLADMGWGQVAPEYVPFHAFLLASVARTIGDRELFLRGVRWDLFSRRHAQAEPGAASLPRWPWSEDSDLAEAVWRRFGKMKPAEIAESELRDLILSLPMGDARRAAAFDTLPIGHAER